MWVGYIGMAIFGKSNWAHLQLALIVREVEGIDPIAFSPVFSEKHLVSRNDGLYPQKCLRTYLIPPLP